VAQYARSLAGTIDAVTLAPGRRLRTAEEMSRFAPFVDAAAAVDRTSFDNTFLSYYTWGAGIGLALDLTLRDRSNGMVTLDHFMRALWQQFGKSGEPVPGYVEKPYTVADLKATLASVSGDAAFADDFFARYIQGHEIVDYARLLGRAGLVLRPRNPGGAFIGDLGLQAGEGVRITQAVPFESPAYKAGLEFDDAIVSIAGAAVATPEDVENALKRQKPGSSVRVVFRRRGTELSRDMTLMADPQIEILPAEQAGQTLTDAQRRFRQHWLGSPSEAGLRRVGEGAGAGAGRGAGPRSSCRVLPASPDAARLLKRNGA
jgi:predicted metalloprotease with PDZ domain